MQSFEDIAEKNNWSQEEQINILLDYIENQNSPEAFADFLSEQSES